MATLEVFLFLLLLFSILFSHPSIAQYDCPAWVCGGNQPIIRFPFRRGEPELEPERCGYPGFDLSCTSSGKTTLKLPSGGFFVRDINYFTQEFILYDPNNCLPKRLLDLDLRGSPFEGVFYHNFTFLNCSSGAMGVSQFAPIDCLSSPNHTILAFSSATQADVMLNSCKLIRTVSIPIPWPIQYGYGGSFDLTDDLRLTWQEPSCGDCEVRGGTCRFKNNMSLETGCFDAQLPGQQTSSHNLPRGLSIGLGIPILMLSVVLVVYFCIRVTSRGQPPPSHSTPASASVLPQPTVVAVGLDRPTIESYPKVVLGESRRLPRPDDGICSICLSEYRAKDTLRCIPECQHFFHADCIDKWLRLNATCPVCRNSPPPVVTAA